MSDKHTPGPWTIYTELPEDRGDYIDHGGYRIDADGIEQLAYVWESSQRINPETNVQDASLPFGAGEAQANARLISAAPDMLEALKAMVVQFGDINEDESHALEDGGEHYRRCLSALTAARSAISKAKGE